MRRLDNPRKKTAKRELALWRTIAHPVPFCLLIGDRSMYRVDLRKLTGFQDLNDGGRE